MSQVDTTVHVAATLLQLMEPMQDREQVIDAAVAAICAATQVLMQVADEAYTRQILAAAAEKVDTGGTLTMFDSEVH